MTLQGAKKSNHSSDNFRRNGNLKSPVNDVDTSESSSSENGDDDSFTCSEFECDSVNQVKQDGLLDASGAMVFNKLDHFSDKKVTIVAFGKSCGKIACVKSRKKAKNIFFLLRFEKCAKSKPELKILLFLYSAPLFLLSF